MSSLGLRRPYLDVGRVSLAVPPRAADAGEGPLRVVELVLVGVEEERGEGFLGEEGNTRG